MRTSETEVTTDELILLEVGSRIDELKNELVTLVNQREQLIKKLYNEGHQQKDIAKLAKVTGGRVSQIVTGYYEK